MSAKPLPEQVMAYFKHAAVQYEALPTIVVFCK